MKKMNLKKGFTRTPKFGVTPKGGGFTLIELLVVVAIIGILASIILASLNSARNKGGDAAIKSNLANIRSQAELIYSASGCYGDGAPVTTTNCVAFPIGACTFATNDTLFANTVVAGQINAAMNISGGLKSCMSTASTWSAGVQLTQNPLEVWCVDSSGKSKKETMVSATQAEINSVITNGSIALCD